MVGRLLGVGSVSHIRLDMRPNAGRVNASESAGVVGDDVTDDVGGDMDTCGVNPSTCNSSVSRPHVPGVVVGAGAGAGVAAAGAGAGTTT